MKKTFNKPLTYVNEGGGKSPVCKTKRQEDAMKNIKEMDLFYENGDIYEGNIKESCS